MHIWKIMVIPAGTLLMTQKIEMGVMALFPVREF